MQLLACLVAHSYTKPGQLYEEYDHLEAATVGQGPATGRGHREVLWWAVLVSPAQPGPGSSSFHRILSLQPSKSSSASKSSPLRPQLSWNRNSHPCGAHIWIPDSQNPWAEESSCLKPQRLGVISYTARVTETESKERFRPRAMRLMAWEARIPRHVTPALTLLITGSSASPNSLCPWMSTEWVKKSSG